MASAKRGGDVSPFNCPAFDDETLDKFLDDTRRYLKIYAEDSPLVIDLAYDGLEIEI